MLRYGCISHRPLRLCGMRFWRSPWRWRLPLPRFVLFPASADQICVRSVCVDNTTIVSVRETPSISRIVLINSSSDAVLRVFNLQQHRMLARYVMAFEDFVELLDGLLELTDSARMADRDSDKSRHVLAQQPRIHRGVIASDDARRLRVS